MGLVASSPITKRTSYPKCIFFVDTGRDMV
nr:MAG TPA: hypothetical protein [Caudoviricetes sp.]